ncbi:MAG: ABC transporter ATP-binding protein [Pseudomonadota bacterium]
MSVNFLSSLKLATDSLEGKRRKLILAIGLATGSVLLEMVPIWVVYRLSLSLVENTSDSGTFFAYAVLLAVVIPTGFFLFGCATRISHTLAFDLIYDLRMRLARHIARVPMGCLSRIRSGQAKQIIVTEPEKLELLIAHAIPEGTSAFITWLIVTGWLFAVDWRMALASILLTPLAFIFMSLAIKVSYPEMASVQQANQQMNGAIGEYLSGMPVIKVFNPGQSEHTEAEIAIGRLADLQSAMGRAFVPMGGTFYALILANIAVIASVGVWLLRANLIDLSTLIFFVVLGANYSTPLMRLFDLFHHFAHISLSATAAQNILSIKPQADSGAHLELAGSNLEFENVGFAYDAGEPVLKNVSFSAHAGSVTALVGASGAGKSTIAMLVPRLYDVTEGRILLGGKDIRDIGFEQLMASVSFVFQEPFLFTASVAENIRFGRSDASITAIRAAARAACIDEFIQTLPEGYDTVIGQGHLQLSGGERQRIALARAILKDAPIVVLDEATAFMDPDSEYEIQQAVAAMTSGKTVIVVAHRLHTVAGADQILVVDRGRIAERGTHAALLSMKGIYARLWADYTEARRSSLHNAKEIAHVD